MNLPLPKLRLRPSTPLAYVRLTVLCIITAVSIGLLYVLYRDFYQTIGQVETVLVLKQEVASQDIALDLWNQVKVVHTYKQTPALSEPIPDPFANAASIAAVEIKSTATTTASTVIPDSIGNPESNMINPGFPLSRE